MGLSNLLTVKEVAAYLKTSRQQVRKMIRLSTTCRPLTYATSFSKLVVHWMEPSKLVIITPSDLLLEIIKIPSLSFRIATLLPT